VNQSPFCHFPDRRRLFADLGPRAKLGDVGKVFETINKSLRVWIKKQSLFFVGTAPRAADGHINLSPKGPMGSFRVVDDHTVAYLDVIGSGAETIAHLRENGRIVIMMCAFEGPPRILRLHGKGEVVLSSDPRFEDLIARCKLEDAGRVEARRAVVIVRVQRISDSCGYGVPLMKPNGRRTQMTAWCDKKLRDGPDALVAYQERKNATSLDGLPAIDAPKRYTRPR
jgi:hypothetical protein